MVPTTMKFDIRYEYTFTSFCPAFERSKFSFGYPRIGFTHLYWGNVDYIHRDEAFLDLSLEISKNSSLSSCLRKFSESELMHKSNQFFCDTCESLQVSPGSHEDTLFLIASILRSFSFVNTTTCCKIFLN